jgi:hypothetical protein
MSCRAILWAVGLLAASAAALVVGCGESPSPPSGPGPPPWFEDVTAARGLDFLHDAGPAGTYFMPQIIGSGCALFDYDNDGRLDIYLLHNGGPKSSSRNRLFHQEPDGRFHDISAGSGLDIAGYGMGVAIGDVNNDGYPDVFVSEYGGAHLFLNVGQGRFREVTQDAGIEHLLWGVSCAFVDYDRDGWLDLVVVNYLDADPTRPCRLAGGQRDYCGPTQFPGTVTNLYRNRGGPVGKPLQRVQFEDVTLSSGLGKLPGPGLGVACADFDGDGWCDLFVANDAKPNRLWINQRNGTFKDEAVARSIACNNLGIPQGNMGVAIGDTDADGLFDIFVTHLTEETHTLWRQAPRGHFQDRTGAAGLIRSRWRGTGFGTVFADFDLDGCPDLALVNGRVMRGPPQGEEILGPYWSRYAERNQLFANDGTGQFHDVSPTNDAFCGAPGIHRALAVGDIDNDGAPDLLVTAVAGPARLYRNVAPRQGHWLAVRVLDPVLRRDAYGAVITVCAGERRWVQPFNPGYSFLCSNDPRVHFGLGSADWVDGVTVRWPDGAEETFPGTAADRLVVLRKGEGGAR